ncbi:nuclease-related domain-containing protein [Bacillus sp. AK128]
MEFLGIVLLVLFVLFSLYKSKIIGSIGEVYVRKQINTLNPEVYKSIHDLYVPTKLGRTSQIDHVIVSEYGIFVIEMRQRIMRVGFLVLKIRNNGHR